MIMDINILFQDKNTVVCLKPAGVDSEGEGMPALLREQTGAAEIFCVHRLDRAVGGVMVYAKTRQAAGKLSAAISSGTVRKEYLAVVSGSPEEPQGTLRDLLFHDKGRNKTYVVNRERRGVKEAVLDYTVLASAEGMSLVRVRLHTGRSHQIRVQFASRGMPLAGDGKYGSTVKLPSPALFSCALAFPHPVSGKELCFSARPGEGFPWDVFREQLAAEAL